MNAVFELDNVGVTIQKRQILRLNQLTLSTSDFTVILGHNGSGKSTLVKLLARQIKPTQGQVSLNGQPLNHFSQRELAKHVAYLGQTLTPAPGLSVRDLVELGRFPARGTFGRLNQQDSNMIDESMRQTNVLAYANKAVDQLSGGERQRAWIAMLLAQNAPTLLLDEPTAALDLLHQYEVLQLMQTLNKIHHKGIIMILHDINLAVRFADRIIALAQGSIVFDGQPKDFLCSKRLSHLYGLNIELIHHPIKKIAPVAIVVE